MRLTPAERSPLFGAAIVILPWLPFRVPAALLLWSGPLMLMVWAAVAAGVASARMRISPQSRGASQKSGTTAAALLALVVYGGSAWWLSPILPDGDEPHYLILAQSIIKDGDIRIENNHQRGDYLEYSLNAAAPDYLRRGLNGEIYSIHAPGLPVLIAPAMGLFGYPGVVALLACIAACSTALVWNIAHRVTGSAGAAWFGWACCALTTPFFFQATEVFPDGIAATCLLLGMLPVWDGLKARPRRDVWIFVVSGVSLAILPWLQTRLAVLAIAAAICVALRLRSTRQLLAFAIVPLASATAWFGFFLTVYGTANPTAPYGAYTQTGIANLVRGFPGLLLDQQFGLIPNAPVYGVILFSVFATAMRFRRWAWETLALIVPYMTAVGSYQMWWGGTSVPGRLLASLALVLGVAAARIWNESRTRATRSVGILALLTSIVITATLLVPGHGQLLLNFRDGISLWLEWANRVLDLPKGVPSVFRDDRAHVWMKSLVWGAAAATVCLAFRFFTDRRGRDDEAPPTLLPWQAIWCAAVAVMLAFTLTWRIDGAQPLTIQNAQIHLLERASTFEARAIDLEARHIKPASAWLSALEMDSDHQRRPPSAPILFAAHDLPAGTYQLVVASNRRAEGTLTVRVGSTPLPFMTVPSLIAQSQPADVPILLSTAVRSLTVEADNEAMRSVSVLKLQPIARAESPGHGVSARRAVRYTSADVFFLDDDAYPEPTGFWVAGGRSTEVAIATHGDSVTLFVRNAPVGNRVTIDADGETRELTLDPGEEQLVNLPARQDRKTIRVRVRSETGFRPSAIDPSNMDLRYLGCWLETR